MELYGISDKDLNEMTDDEEAYLNKLYQIYYFIQEDNDISDWSTKNIGTFFVQTMMETINSNKYYEIDDLFTHQIGNVSWPDIAMMYNLKDFRILTEYGNKLNTPARYKDPEPCEVWDISCYSIIERYSPFQSCFKEVSDNYQSDEVTIFRKEDKMEKAIQSSPCQNLEKFQNCSDYCAWHNIFFESIGKEEFLQAMSYASPQRKVYKESMPIEKKMAGTVKDLGKDISLE